MTYNIYIKTRDGATLPVTTGFVRVNIWSYMIVHQAIILLCKFEKHKDKVVPVLN
jgi:hypothetical protein